MMSVEPGFIMAVNLVVSWLEPEKKQYCHLKLFNDINPFTPATTGRYIYLGGEQVKDNSA